MNLRNVSWITLICLAATGCGGVKHGDVSGRVTNKGNVLPGGTVTFWPQGSEAGASPVFAKIQDDGSYTAAKVPAGEVAVTVETESLGGGRPQTGIPGMGKTKDGKRLQGGPPPEIMAQINQARGGNVQAEVKAASDKYRPIDKKYANPQLSGFKLTVQSGSQEFNIDLK
jgi:hypothetical protein